MLSGLLRWVASDDQAGLLREALAACTDSLYPAWNLGRIAERVPDRLDQVLAAARTIDNPYDRASALASLAARMAESERVGVLQEALAAARAVNDPGTRVKALAHVLEKLDQATRPGVVEEALVIARAINDPPHRAEALANLLRWVAEEDQAGVLRGALAAARAPGGFDPNRTLAEVLERAPDRLLGQALAAARAIDDVDRRAQALASLAGRAAEEQRGSVLDEALAAAQSVSSARSALILAKLVKGDPHGKHLSWRSHYRQLLTVFSTHGRASLLADLQALLPMLLAVGGTTTLLETKNATIDVGRWWP